MAEEEVIISNVGKDGVASEVTLQRLLSVMEKAKGLDDKGRKNLEGLAKAAKDSKGKFESFSEEIEKTTTIMEDVGNTLKKTFTIENFGKALGAAAGITTNFVKELATGGDELGDFAQHIPVVGGSLGMLTGFLQDSLDTFRALSDVGAGFGNDLLELRRVAASAGVPLDMFASLISQNADSMRLLGNTTSQGATVFAKLAKDMRSGDIGRRLLNMGFTTEELTEGLGNYIDLQARLGRAGQMSNAQLVQGSQTYLTELDRLARVTGQSRKALQEEIAAMAQKSNLQALADAIGGQGGDNFLAGMAAARKLLPGFGDALEDLADGVAQTPLAKKLAALSPAVADAAAAFGRGEITQEEFFDSLKNVGGPQLLQFVDSLDATTRSALLQQEGFSEMLGSVHEMRKFIDSEFDSAEAKKQQDRRNRVNEGLSTFQDSLMKVRQEFVNVFVESGLAAKLSELLVTFSEQLLGATKYFSEMLNKFSTDPVGTIFEMLGDGLSKVWENKGIVASVVGGIAALFAAKAVVGALSGAFKSAIGGTVSNIAGKIFSGGDAASGGGAPKAPKGKPGAAGGRAGAQIGNFVGQMGAGVMKGAAAGLKAFANPQILVGATILAGTITIVGAGIAAAAWLTGKALPTFVEGIKSFEELDGAALSAVASGMIDLSLAMAAFGAGTAVAGLGSMIGGITEGIGKLFGAEDPIDKLVRFSKADIDAVKVKANAEAMVAFSSAMALAGAGSAAEGLGSLVSGIAGGIGALFGGKDTMDIVGDMQKFAAVTVDKTIVQNNAEALSTFSTAMANVVQMPAASIFSSISSAISGLFGAETPFEQLVSFGNLAVNTAGVTANATAMATFSSAMSGVVMMPSQGVFSSFASALSGLFGGDTPFDQLAEFGALAIDAEGVKTNAEAMNAMSVALQGFATLSEIEINKNLASRLSDLAVVPDMTAFADNIKQLSGAGTVEGVTALNSLDTAGVLSYTTAMENLVEVLKELNDELSKDNKVGFGSGTNAGDVVSKMETIGGGGGGSQMSEQQLNRLNTTLDAVKTILEENRDYNQATAKAVKNGDLQLGL